MAWGSQPGSPGLGPPILKLPSMGISEVAELAVELVGRFVEGSEQGIPADNDGRYDSLKAEPEYSALVIHAAVARRLPIDGIVRVTAFLETPPERVAALLPVEYLQEHGGRIPAFRKQYQRLMAEQTRTMTFDVLAECTPGYALVYQVFRRGGRASYDAIWTQALGVIGMFDLEPFKVMALWIACFPEQMYPSFVAWIRHSIWNKHPDWLALLHLARPVNRARFVATLIAHDVVSLDTVWGMHTANTDAKFTQFEEKWRRENTNGPTRLNALAMAMPLIDDDDDDEEEELANEEVNLDEAAGTEGPATQSNPETAMEVEGSPSAPPEPAPPSADEDPEDHTAVEFLRDVVGNALSALAYTANPALEETLVRLVNRYPVAFGTADSVLYGMSRLLASKISPVRPSSSERAEKPEEPEEREDTPAPAVDLATLQPYWRPIAHSIMEPAWNALTNHILAIEDPTSRLEIFRQYMLPSIDVHPRKMEVLLGFSTRERYMLYTDLYSRLAVTNEMVKARFTQAERNTKDILKRLTRKDAEKIIVPQLLEQFAHCAWPSLNVFVNQVESYNIGTLVAQAAAACPTVPARGRDNADQKNSSNSNNNHNNTAFAPLAMDMLPLVLMQQFTGGRDATQKDGLHTSKWLRLLAQFAGDIATGHPQFDFVVLVKMVLHQFANNNFSGIYLLDQIVRKLSGIPFQSNLSPVQLLGLNSAPPVAELVQKEISEQPNPQMDRLLKKLREDPDGDLVSLIVAALSYSYTESVREQEVKVLASKQDAITNLALLFREFELDPSTDRSKITAKFAANLMIGPQEEKATEFNTLRLYDVAVEPKIYSAVQPYLDEKTVERALLSHKIRVKSVKQRLAAAPLPSMDALLSRILLSPSDALFASRFLQLIYSGHDGLPLLSRGVVLAVINGATPLEAESYAMFVTDLLSYIYMSNAETGVSIEELRDLLSNFTSAILEAAVPDAPFTVLGNVFNLLQRTLPVFPLFKSDGGRLTKRIQLLTTTTQGDLETAVKSLNPQLLQRAKQWSTDEITPEFVAQLSLHYDRLLSRFAAGMVKSRNQRG